MLCITAKFAMPMSLLDHSRPMHSVPGPINVRCYSNNDIIVRRGEVTLRARSGHDPSAASGVPHDDETDNRRELCRDLRVCYRLCMISRLRRS